jgi:type II secretory pathway pseudopilin PulG
VAAQVGGLIAAALVTSMVSPARAADATAESEALIHQALQLRSENKPERALPLLEQAYRTSRNPRSAAHLGLVEMELSNFVLAERYLTEALATPTHPWIAKNKASLQQQLADAKGNIGELAVAGSPAGAEIWVNGSQAGQLPLSAPLRLAKGRVDVKVVAPGYVAATESVTIVGGKREKRSFALAPTAPVTPPPVVPLAPVAASGGVEPPRFTPSPTPAAAATVVAKPSPPADRRQTLRTAGWITGGVAAGALVFGTIEAFQAASARDTFNNHMGSVGGVYGKDCGTATLSAACKPLKADYDHAVTGSVVGFVAAGVLGAGAAALFALSSPSFEPWWKPAPASTSVRALACIPDPASRSIACSLRF